MRRSTRRRFETYRRQTRTLTFDDKARSETLRIIQAMRAEQAQDEAVAVPDAPVVVQTTRMTSPARKRHEPRRWADMRVSFALKAAACAVVAVGIALFAVAGITPTVDRERSIAIASSPSFRISASSSITITKEYLKPTTAFTSPCLSCSRCQGTPRETQRCLLMGQKTRSYQLNGFPMRSRNLDRPQSKQRSFPDR